jgi:chromosome segregation ATPase
MQEAVAGGGEAIERELTNALQVITKLEADLNDARTQTDDAKLAASSLEQQMANVQVRLGESDAKCKAMEEEHAEKVDDRL